jgi:hypothetical protein
MRPNPHYRQAAPMRLYSAARVEAAEQGPDFVAHLAKVQQRRQRGLAQAAHKRQQILAWVDGLTITVPSFEPETLTALACEHYNDGEFVPEWVLERQARLGEWDRGATPDSDPAFLARITVNFLRHGCTEYEALLDRTFGQVGTEEAKAAIRRRVLEAIAQTYPALTEECRQQRLARRR